MSYTICDFRIRRAASVAMRGIRAFRNNHPVKTVPVDAQNIFADYATYRELTYLFFRWMMRES